MNSSNPNVILFYLIPYFTHEIRCAIWYKLCNIKKREKHPQGSVSFSIKSNTPPWLFFTFLKKNCTNDTKSLKAASYIILQYGSESFAPIRLISKTVEVLSDENLICMLEVITNIF